MAVIQRFVSAFVPFRAAEEILKGESGKGKVYSNNECRRPLTAVGARGAQVAPMFCNLSTFGRAYAVVVLSLLSDIVLVSTRRNGTVHVNDRRVCSLSVVVLSLSFA